MNGSITSKLHPRHPGLTIVELFALFKAAIKDDDHAVNLLIETVRDDLMRYDRERTRTIMELMVRRDPVARNSFHALLTEARRWHLGAKLPQDAPKGKADTAHLEPLTLTCECAA